MVVNFRCQLNGAKVCTDNWENIILGCICEGAFPLAYGDERNQAEDELSRRKSNSAASYVYGKLVLYAEK